MKAANHTNKAKKKLLQKLRSKASNSWIFSSNGEHELSGCMCESENDLVAHPREENWRETHRLDIGHFLCSVRCVEPEKGWHWWGACNGTLVKLRDQCKGSQQSTCIFAELQLCAALQKQQQQRERWAEYPIPSLGPEVQREEEISERPERKDAEGKMQRGMCTFVNYSLSVNHIRLQRSNSDRQSWSSTKRTFTSKWDLANPC